ncbi:MAG: RNA polymerase factor sigma-54 [Lachnospiraceae bacterium]|nr:RNA polymerase factor sigma-54 [Lachnospiraceae bacterium]
MQIGMDISIRQTQKLVLTPQMEQALSVLQMGAEELNQCIEEELLSNPMLDSSGEDEKKEIRQSYGEGIRYRARKSNEDEDGQSELNAIADEKSYDTGLKEVLRMQLYAKKVGAKRQRRAEYLIECLEETGYLKIESEELTKSLQITQEELEKEIAFLQQFEPCGVFARDLKECLLLQLKGEDEKTEKLRLLVGNYLNEIAGNKIPQISKETGWTLEETIEVVQDIKKELEPIPGRGYGSETNNFIYPDITIKQDDDGYHVIYNRERIRNLELNREYLSLLSGQYGKEENDYFQEQYQKAQIFIKNIGKREETLRAVTEAIVDYQRTFFERGKAFLKPMNLWDIAQELEIHESTVSRAIRDKYLECRWGIFELKYFFSNKTSEGNHCNVRSLIEEMIKAENKKRPLSDAKIAEQLESRGVRISRRTVAKYREQLSIPNTQRRREYA